MQDVLIRIKVKCLEVYREDRLYIKPTEEKKTERREQKKYLTCFGRYDKKEKTDVAFNVIRKLQHASIPDWSPREKAILNDGKLSKLLRDLEAIDIPPPTGICAWLGQFCESRPKPVTTTVQSKKNQGCMK